MYSNQYKKISLMEIEQNGRVFYLGKVNIRDFGNLTTADPMKYQVKVDQLNNVDHTDFDFQGSLANGQNYQRAKKESRVNDIARYLKTNTDVDSIIPNTILLSVKATEINSLDELENQTSQICYLSGGAPAIFIKNELFNMDLNDARAKKFFIIDGNHRVNGIMKYLEETGVEVFEMPISLLINKEKRHEAEIFKTVNYESKPVNKSYYYQIIGEFGLGTEQERFLHKAAEVFNTHTESPLKGLIKMLGTPYEHENRQAFSQSFFIEQLNEWLFKDRQGVKVLDYYGVSRIPVLRYYFVNDKNLTFKILWNYFSDIKDLFEIRYGDGSWFNLHNQLDGIHCTYDANYLLKPVGIGAFIELFPIIFMKTLDDLELINRQEVIITEGIKVIDFRKYLGRFFDGEYSIQDHIKESYVGASGQGLVRKFAEDLLQNRFVPTHEYAEAERRYLLWYKSNMVG